MSKETKVKLNIGERFHLIALLPEQGNYVTFKTLRKLRETLAPNEAEASEYGFVDEYQCTNVDYDERGKGFQCEYKLTPLKTPSSLPVCPIHEKACMPTGKLSWNPELADREKEIWFSPSAVKIVHETLERLNIEEQLSEKDGTLALFEKFVGAED